MIAIGILIPILVLVVVRILIVIRILIVVRILVVRILTILLLVVVWVIVAILILSHLTIPVESSSIVSVKVINNRPCMLQKVAHRVLAARLSSKAELHVSRVVYYAATLTLITTAATAPAAASSLSAVSADVVKEAAWSVISAARVLSDPLNDRLQHGWRLLARILIPPVAWVVSPTFISR